MCVLFIDSQCLSFNFFTLVKVTLYPRSPGVSFLLPRLRSCFHVALCKMTMTDLKARLINCNLYVHLGTCSHALVFSPRCTAHFYPEKKNNQIIDHFSTARMALHGIFAQKNNSILFLSNGKLI